MLLAMVAVSVLAASPLQAVAEPAPPIPMPSPFARCEAESRRRFGQGPESAIGTLGSLKRLRGPQPKYPDLPRGTRGRGDALHELLIAPDGKVRHVWAVREPSFEPAFPAFGLAIVAALKEWQYEPVKVEGRFVPVCLMVTTNINWK